MICKKMHVLHEKKGEYCSVLDILIFVPFFPLSDLEPDFCNERKSL